MSRLISKMSTMKKETNIKVEFITFYKFCVTAKVNILDYSTMKRCKLTNIETTADKKKVILIYGKEDI